MRRGAGAVALLVLAAGLTACGDDDGGASSSGGGDKDRFCALASQQDIEGLDDFDPSKKGDLAELDAALDDLHDAAPGEIRDDVDTVSAGLRELVELASVDRSDPDAMAELRDRASELQGRRAEMQAAAQRVEQYREKECGVDEDS
jgi:hypothetical protein